MARFLPADHSRGDANTIGGYMAVHDRPAAFEGSDGVSYSVELMVDETETGPAGDPPGEPARRFAGYLLFLRWKRVGEQGVEGHFETDYLAYAATPREARAAVGALRLSEVRALLEGLLRERRGGGGRPSRRWWDAMRDDDEGGAADNGDH